ncbi:unnamed protein product [Caenorhabditis brenneri]
MRLFALLVIVILADTVSGEDPPTTQPSLLLDYVYKCVRPVSTFGQNTTEFVKKYNEQLPTLLAVREFVVKEANEIFLSALKESKGELSDFVSSIIKQLRQRVANIANRLGFPIGEAVLEYWYQVLEPFVIDELHCLERIFPTTLLGL